MEVQNRRLGELLTRVRKKGSQGFENKRFLSVPQVRSKGRDGDVEQGYEFGVVHNLIHLVCQESDHPTEDLWLLDP